MGFFYLFIYTYILEITAASLAGEHFHIPVKHLFCSTGPLSWTLIGPGSSFDACKLGATPVQ